MYSSTRDEAPPPAEPRADGDRLPRWIWAGFGASLGVTTVFAAAAVGTTLRLSIGLRKDLIDAVDASTADDNPENDISRGAEDLCAAARASPQNDGRVTNGAVTKVCNRGDRMKRAQIGMIGVTAVGLASTLVFAILLAVNPKPRRRELTLAPRFHGRGASLVVGGRF